MASIEQAYYADEDCSEGEYDESSSETNNYANENSLNGIDGYKEDDTFDDRTIDSDEQRDVLEQNRTRLHDLIEVKHWDEIMSILEDIDERKLACIPYPNRTEIYPLHAVCDFVDLVEGEVDQDENNKVIFSAFLPPPPDLIKSLIDAYPDAVKKRGEDGCLPLHLAAKRGLCKESVERIIRAFPPALHVQDVRGLTPRDYVRQKMEISTMLDRPVSCWYQQIRDDRIAESLKSELEYLEKEAKFLTDEVSKSLNEEKLVESELTKIEQDIIKLSSYSHGNQISKFVSDFEKEMNVEINDASKKLAELVVTMKLMCSSKLNDCINMKDFSEDIIKLHVDLDLHIVNFHDEIENIRNQIHHS